MLKYPRTRILLSIIFSVIAYILGIIAEATKETGLPIYMASCLTKIFLFIIAVPIAHSAGKILRADNNMDGVPGLRFVSWIMYGVTIIHFISFFIWTGDGSILPDGQITIDAAIFFISSMLMNADSWNSYKTGK